jgi:DinB superfamily
MTKVFVAMAMLVCVPTMAQDQKPAEKPVTLRSTLLAQLKSTHNVDDWFVSEKTAVAGLTPEQANWSDGKGNHSVGQLVFHLVFWNERNLKNLKGEQQAKFSGNNEDSFAYDGKSWNENVQKLDSVLTELEKMVESADDAKLAKMANAIQHISAHNAYHIGEIVMVRKEQGSWDASKGVK